MRNGIDVEALVPVVVEFFRSLKEHPDKGRTLVVHYDGSVYDNNRTTLGTIPRARAAACVFGWLDRDMTSNLISNELTTASTRRAPTTENA